MHEEIKAATGIKCANCSTCSRLGSDGDGPEYNGSWSICNKVERYGYLRSFPFKKEMKCWEPDFWHSKFTDPVRMRTGSDREMSRLTKQFWAAVEAAKAKQAVAA